MTLDLDDLFAIAEAAPGLDEVERALRDAGLDEEAGALVKLQQDAGVAIDREMTGGEPAGPESARLDAAFVPVTRERAEDLFRAIWRKTPEGKLDIRFYGLLRALRIDPEAPAARTTPSGPSFS